MASYSCATVMREVLDINYMAAFSLTQGSSQIWKISQLYELQYELAQRELQTKQLYAREYLFPFLFQGRNFHMKNSLMATFRASVCHHPLLPFFSLFLFHGFFRLTYQWLPVHNAWALLPDLVVSWPADRSITTLTLVYS